MSIASEISRLRQAKVDIVEALSEKGVKADANISFSDIASKILEIQ